MVVFICGPNSYLRGGGGEIQHLGHWSRSQDFFFNLLINIQDLSMTDDFFKCFNYHLAEFFFVNIFYLTCKKIPVFKFILIFLT